MATEPPSGTAAYSTACQEVGRTSDRNGCWMIADAGLENQPAGASEAARLGTRAPSAPHREAATGSERLRLRPAGRRGRRSRPLAGDGRSVGASSGSPRRTAGHGCRARARMGLPAPDQERDCDPDADEGGDDHRKQQRGRAESEPDDEQRHEDCPEGDRVPSAPHKGWSTRRVESESPRTASPSPGGGASRRRRSPGGCAPSHPPLVAGSRGGVGLCRALAEALEEQLEHGVGAGVAGSPAELLTGAPGVEQRHRERHVDPTRWGRFAPMSSAPAWAPGRPEFDPAPGPGIMI